MVSTRVVRFRSLLLTGLFGMLLALGCVAVSPESDSETAPGTEPAVQPGESSPPEETTKTEAPAATRVSRPATAPARAKTKTEASSEPRVSESTPAPRRETSFTDIALPAGTHVELALLTPLDSATNAVGDEVRAKTLSPLDVDGRRALAAGSEVVGRVTEVEASGKVKGRAKLAFTFDRLTTPSGVVDIETSFVSLEAKSGKKKDAAVIGGAAGVGAIVGGIIGGKKGAAIGASIGGAGGTGVVLSTKGEEIRLTEGTELEVRLDAPVTLRVPES
jgi:hypothetical protein